LGPAGYSWNEDLGVCVREWELDDDQRGVIKVAVHHLNYRITVIEVLKSQSSGCFQIKLQRNDNQNIFNITMED
jgi:hypothetical protein